ncbi:MAG: bifunctional oligoribonuclease/PAP phosphatase NrnA [Anaerolineales bacterium]|jgi:phosphoesterase RecJ-like protein|nr:bifunctional oligoribonuclease/PAP phosphatase NrnA [Anaerolineales bacterium]
MTAEIDEMVREKFSKAQNILIVSHVRPDGDAVGSLLGLGMALKNAGKQVQMVLNDGIPALFSHLPGAELVKKSPEADFDLFITVDCADFKRTGPQFQTMRKPDINIDHHITNEKYGEINIIDPAAVATCAILADFIPNWGLDINQDIAASLVTGIVTDTLGFRTANTTPASLRQTASLMETGINMPNLYNRALNSRQIASARYWGAGLSSLKSENGIVYGTLTLNDRLRCDYPGNDDGDLINVISTIEDHAVGMIFVEQTDGHVKISWRALQPGIDVSVIAKHFNGGGHPAAAGADLAGTLEEIQALTLTTTRQMLNLF